MLLSPQSHKSWKSIYIKELLNSEWLKEECRSLVTHCGFVTRVQLQEVENTHPHQHKKKNKREPIRLTIILRARIGSESIDSEAMSKIQLVVYY